MSTKRVLFLLTKESPYQGFTAQVLSLLCRPLFSRKAITVNVNDCCIWVRACSSPLTVDSSSVAMEMASYVRLLFLVKIPAWVVGD